MKSVNSSGGTSVSSSKLIIGSSNRCDNRGDIGFGGGEGGNMGHRILMTRKQVPKIPYV